MKIYIDCDGVIIDSEKLLFGEEYYEKNIKGYIKSEKDKIKYVQNVDWSKLLKESEIINDSINILKSIKYDFAILTKIHSLTNEGDAKIKMFRELGIKNEIILVPYTVGKQDVVSAKNSILIDDTVRNLDLWKNDGGISIYFNKDNLDIDGWNIENSEYPKICNLNELNNIKKLIKTYNCN